MGVSIDGIVVPGIRLASVALRIQLPHLIEHFPEIKAVRAGTVNLRLARPLIVSNPTFTTPPITWNGFTEKFSFLRIRIECPLGEEPQEAWIYMPHKSPHRSNPFIAEIIAEELDGAYTGAPCRIHLMDCVPFTGQ